MRPRFVYLGRMLPDDLKNYSAEEDSFQLIPSDVAGTLLLIALAVVLILDHFHALPFPR